MHHLQYCLEHHPGVFSNITNSSRFRMPPTLAHCPPYPGWNTTHADYTGTSLTLTRHPCKRTTHAIHANNATRHTCHPRKHTTKQPRHIIQLIN